MQPDPNDPDIRGAIANSKAQTFAEMTAEIVERFGQARAWPAAWVKATRLEIKPPRSGARSRFEEDREVMDFISERGDLVHLSNLHRLGVAAFGEERFPSRSQLHRLVVKARGWTPSTADAAKW